MKDTLISKERKSTLLVLLVIVMLFLVLNSFLTAKADEAPAPEPTECSYHPGLSRDIQYDYITVSWHKFIVFRDTNHGGISVVFLY